MYSVKVNDNERYATYRDNRVVRQERFGRLVIINSMQSEMRYTWKTVEVVSNAISENEARFRVRRMARKASAA